MKRHLTIGALLALGLATPAAAQTPVDPKPGPRIRIIDDQGHKTVGTLYLATADSLVVDTNYGARRRRVFHVSSVTALQVSEGRYAQVGRTTFTCVGAFALTFGVLTAASTQVEGFMAGAVLGAMIGLPVGLVAGLIVRYDRWADVPLPRGRTREPVIESTRRPGRRFEVGLSIPLGGRPTPRGGNP